MTWHLLDVNIELECILKCLEPLCLFFEIYAETCESYIKSIKQLFPKVFSLLREVDGDWLLYPFKLSSHDKGWEQGWKN